MNNDFIFELIDCLIFFLLSAFIDEVDCRGLDVQQVNDILRNLERDKIVCIEILRNYDRDLANPGTPLPPISSQKGYCHM